MGTDDKARSEAPPVLVISQAPGKNPFSHGNADTGTCGPSLRLPRAIQATMVKLSGGTETIRRGMDSTMANIKARAQSTAP